MMIQQYDGNDTTMTIQRYDDDDMPNVMMTAEEEIVITTVISCHMIAKPGEYDTDDDKEAEENID